MNQDIKSQTLKCKGKTYFFDVKKAQNGYLYLQITESRISGNEKKRNTVIIFEDDIDKFKENFYQASELLLDKGGK